MAKNTYDCVIEAVHYKADGQVDWVRMYERRGPTWSDRIILPRQDLIKLIQSGKRAMLGQRVEYMAGTFDVTVPVLVAGSGGKEVLVTSASQAEHDRIEGAPVL